MKLILIGLILIAIAAWIGTQAGHWANHNIKPRTIQTELIDE